MDSAKRFPVVEEPPPWPELPDRRRFAEREEAFTTWFAIVLIGALGTIAGVLIYFAFGG